MDALSTVRSIYFSDNDAALSEDSRRAIRQHAEYLNQNLKQNPKLLIVIRAYLDHRGSRTFALAMAQKRLNVVMAVTTSTSKYAKEIIIALEFASK